MAIFLKTSIYDSYMSHIYAIYIFSESEFSGEFYENKMFRIRPRKILRKFWNLTSSEMRGRFFFSFSNSKRTQKSGSNDIHLYKFYPTPAHAERTLNFRGPLTPTHYGSTLKSFEIVTIGDTCSWKGQLERTRSWKVLSWKVWSWKVCRSWKEPSEVGKNPAKLERTQRSWKVFF